MLSFFKFEKNKTTLGRETLAGFTTFAAMAYILAVNPMILSSTGMDTQAVIMATAVAAVFLPLAQGPLQHFSSLLTDQYTTSAKTRTRSLSVDA